MKKLLLVFLTFLICLSVSALPPMPGKVKFTQPDGTTILLEVHGNAHVHWYSDESGRRMEKDKDGFWRPVLWEGNWNNGSSRRNFVSLNDDEDDDYDDDDDEDEDEDEDEGEEEEYEPITTGVRHFPVVLVNFTDVKYVLDDPAARISDMLNRPGYGYNGATGSVRDYYYENSGGVFEPVFDVYGPYDLQHNMAYYGEDFINGLTGAREDMNPIDLLYEAFLHLTKEVGLSRYDSNGDGKVDMFLVFYAGYNQAEHGPEDSIWPYAGLSPYKAGVKFEADGVKVDRFFMTSELRGGSGSNICGVGTPAHEFGHALGMPDFYDTDGKGSGGIAGGMYNFSLMDHGCYNNDAKTPPYLSSEEKILLGWMTDEDTQAMPGGQVSLEPVNRNKALRSYTDVEGEYFVYEYRSGQGWDAYAPQGLLVYHVDKSKGRKLSGIDTPYSLWHHWESSNRLNAYGLHPCCYVIPADDQTNLNYPYKGRDAYMIFPGAASVSAYTPVDWEGSTTGVSLSGISYNGSAATWKADVHIDQRIVGTVTTPVGVPVPGARIIVHPLLPASQGTVTGVADEKGHYEVILTGRGWEKVSVRASAEGYASSSVDCTPNPRKTVLPLFLERSEDAHDVSICYIDYEETDDEDGIGIGGRNKRIQCAMYVPVADLEKHVGKQIKQIRFRPSTRMSEARSADIFIENTEKELLRVKNFPFTEETWYSVDVREYNLVVEKDKPLYVGWQLSTPDYGYTVYQGTNLYVTDDESAGKAHTWTPSADMGMPGFALGCKLVLGEKAVPNPYSAMGINSIRQEDSYKAGDYFCFQLVTAKEDAPAQVTWLFDGTAFEDGDAVQLDAGSHHVEATLQYADGRKEILETELEVK